MPKRERRGPVVEVSREPRDIRLRGDEDDIGFVYERQTDRGFTIAADALWDLIGTYCR